MGTNPTVNILLQIFGSGLFIVVNHVCENFHINLVLAFKNLMFKNFLQQSNNFVYKIAGG